MAQGRRDFPLFSELLRNMSEASRVNPHTNISIFKRLENTLDSMKPMISEMDPMDPVFCRMLERLTDLVPPLPEFPRQLTQPGCSNEAELEELNEKLKKFFKAYVMLKLDQANEVEDQVNGPEERVVTCVLELSTEVGCLIKIEMPKDNVFMKHVFGNLEIIRGSIDEQLLQLTHQLPYSGAPIVIDVPQLLRLLKQVKVLLRFLHGHHGMDIQKYLVEREKELRRFVVEEVREQLLNRDKNQDLEGNIALFLFSVFVLYMTYPPDSLIYFILFMVAFILIIGDVLVIIEKQRMMTKHESDILFFLFLICVLCLTYPPIIPYSLFMAALLLIFGFFESKYEESKKKGRVFLNFRGDTRRSVACLLQEALEKEGISTYMDEKAMPYRGTIPEELVMEINKSIGVVTIFSEKYAESDDCLAELLLIQKRRMTHKDYVLFPVFYNVEPEELLARPGSKYFLALQEHMKGEHKEEVNEWREVLAIFASIKGEVYKSDQHYMNNLINTVITDVKRQMEIQRRL